MNHEPEWASKYQNNLSRTYTMYMNMYMMCIYIYIFIHIAFQWPLRKQKLAIFGQATIIAIEACGVFCDDVTPIENLDIFGVHVGIVWGPQDSLVYEYDVYITTYKIAKLVHNYVTFEFHVWVYGRSHYS